MPSVLDDLELAALGDSGLVDVAAEDELRPRVGERAEDGVAVMQRTLPPCAPRRCGELVVQGDDAESTRRCSGEPLRSAGERVGRQRTALLPPGSHRAQPDTDDVLGPVCRFGRAEDVLPGRKRAGEPSRHGVRDVVIPGHGQKRWAERAQKVGGAPELVRASAVPEIPGRDDELGSELVDELAERREGLGRLPAPDVQVRDMENPCCHGRSRLYTRNVADEAPELFDDIYLGLRAGGAVRKQRRGESLSAEEEEAIGRWQRLSLWRKSIAVGAFALGTFGLGFTVGGLIFGRWRTARR